MRWKQQNKRMHIKSYIQFKWEIYCCMTMKNLQLITIKTTVLQSWHFLFYSFFGPLFLVVVKWQKLWINIHFNKLHLEVPQFWTLPLLQLNHLLDCPCKKTKARQQKAWHPVITATSWCWANSTLHCWKWGAGSFTGGSLIWCTCVVAAATLSN